MPLGQSYLGGVPPTGNPWDRPRPFIPAPQATFQRQGLPPSRGMTPTPMFNPKPNLPLPTSAAPANQGPVAGVDNQQNDYTDLIGKYDAQIGKISGRPTAVPHAAQGAPVSAVHTQYTEDPRHSAGMANLAEMAASGGYSAADKADLRARGVAPIRSAYASAKRDADRKRSIQGGYSPNAGAGSTRFAREQAGLVGDKISDVNAGIAEKVAGNRTQLAPAWTNAGANITGMQNSINAANAGADNNVNQFNAGMDLNYDQLNAGIDQNNIGNQTTQDNQVAQLLQGQAGLYGTTPGRAALFGNQALQGQQQSDAQSRFLTEAWLRANG